MNENPLARLDDITVDCVTLQFEKTFLAKRGAKFGVVIHSIIAEADKKGFKLCRPAISEIDGRYAITFARKDSYARNKGDNF